MPASERGAALVFVLLIVATLSIIAVQINEQLRFNVKRLDNQRQNNQAYWYALGGEQLAQRLLKQVADDSRTSLAQAWATEDAVFPIDDGLLQGRIVDAQACFNLNNLLDCILVSSCILTFDGDGKEVTTVLDIQILL